MDDGEGHRAGASARPARTAQTRGLRLMVGSGQDGAIGQRLERETGEWRGATATSNGHQVLSRQGSHGPLGGAV